MVYYYGYILLHTHIRDPVYGMAFVWVYIVFLSCKDVAKIVP
jgi:hypothetical protein